MKVHSQAVSDPYSGFFLSQGLTDEMNDEPTSNARELHYISSLFIITIVTSFVKICVVLIFCIVERSNSLKQKFSFVHFLFHSLSLFYCFCLPKMNLQEENRVFSSTMPLRPEKEQCCNRKTLL